MAQALPLACQCDGSAQCRADTWAPDCAQQRPPGKLSPQAVAIKVVHPSIGAGREPGCSRDHDSSSFGDQKHQSECNHQPSADSSQRIDGQADQALTLDTEILRLDAVLADLAVLELGNEGRRGQADLVQPILRVHHQYVLATQALQYFGHRPAQGLAEYAYNLMARAAGIELNDSTLIHNAGLAHFATRRFDRAHGRKVHLHSLCGLQHADFNQPRVWSYEMYLRTCLKLGLGMDEMSEAYRRMVFNVVARNQDDHTKNLAFLLFEDQRDWRLAPAFDITYANGAGWTSAHQMSVNGKFDGMGRADLETVATLFGIRKWKDIVAHVNEAVARWPEFASEAGLDEELTAQISTDHRAL